MPSATHRTPSRASPIGWRPLNAYKYGKVVWEAYTRRPACLNSFGLDAYAQKILRAQPRSGGRILRVVVAGVDYGAVTVVVPETSTIEGTVESLLSKAKPAFKWTISPEGDTLHIEVEGIRPALPPRQIRLGILPTAADPQPSVITVPVVQGAALPGTTTLQSEFVGAAKDSAPRKIFTTTRDHVGTVAQTSGVGVPNMRADAVGAEASGVGSAMVYPVSEVDDVHHHHHHHHTLQQPVVLVPRGTRCTRICQTDDFTYTFLGNPGGDNEDDEKDVPPLEVDPAAAKAASAKVAPPVEIPKGLASPPVATKAAPPLMPLAPTAQKPIPPLMQLPANPTTAPPKLAPLVRFPAPVSAPQKKEQPMPTTKPNTPPVDDYFGFLANMSKPTAVPRRSPAPVGVPERATNNARDTFAQQFIELFCTAIDPAFGRTTPMFFVLPEDRIASSPSSSKSGISMVQYVETAKTSQAFDKLKRLGYMNSGVMPADIPTVDTLALRAGTTGVAIETTEYNGTKTRYTLSPGQYGAVTVTGTLTTTSKGAQNVRTATAIDMIKPHRSLPGIYLILLTEPTTAQ